MFSKSTSYDADTEDLAEASLGINSGGSTHIACCSKSVEVQTEDCQRQGCNRPPLSPSLTITPSPTHRTKQKTTSSLNSPIPPPIPPRNKPLKSSVKITGSVNWLDRSSSIFDLGSLFQEVRQSREALQKSRESLSRSADRNTLRVHSPLSRTKSVSNLHSGLAGNRDSGLSQSSWELGDTNTSPPYFHPLRMASSISFSENKKPKMLSTSPSMKYSPALRRLTTKDQRNIEDSVYHTVHTPSHASMNLHTKSSGRPITPHTPAFHEDVYYTIQGGGGVTQHYQTEEYRRWQPLGSVPMHHPKDAYISSCSSSEEGFEEDDPLYEPLHESPANMSPSEAYNPHYSLEIPCFSPRSPKFYHHHSPPHTSHYPTLSPKSPKHHHYSPKSSHQYSHSTHQFCQSPQCSPQSPHCLSQSYHYPRTCMYQSYPYPPSSRPWPSPSAQLERGRSCSWTVSSCTR